MKLSKVLNSREYYSTGATTMFASQADQRFSYCLYVPARRETDAETFPLVVIQHGTGRTAAQYRDAMADFCEEHRAVVLAPLFPAAIEDPEDLHNYKFIEYRGIRFDLLLLRIIDEVGEKFPIDTGKFFLHGFSGGGQFVHRFLYLHPDRLRAASIGAPGRITMLDDSEPWWLGTKDLEGIFGKAADVAAISAVPIHLVVGELDTDTWETNNRNESTWLDGLEKQGDTRVERIQSLKRNLASHGISAHLDIVEGMAHDGMKALPAVRRFFATILNAGGDPNAGGAQNASGDANGHDGGTPQSDTDSKEG
jgi:poly(3-hydroxybutyrate) depolymerase